jgi:hypothetical protein
MPDDIAVVDRISGAFGIKTEQDSVKITLDCMGLAIPGSGRGKNTGDIAGFQNDEFGPG